VHPICGYRAIVRHVERVLVLAVAGIALTACGGGPEAVPAVNDGMACDEVIEVVEGAIAEGQRFVSRDTADQQLAADLVFALSGAVERSECITEQTRSRADGLRTTIAGLAAERQSPQDGVGFTEDDGPDEGVEGAD
jgi:hypothetical protein